MVKVKWSRYIPGLAQRVGRGTALLFNDHDTRREWVISSTPRPHFIPGKDPVPILQKAGWAPGPVWTGGKSHPHRDSIPDRPARSQSLYGLSYPDPKTFRTFRNPRCWKSDIKDIHNLKFRHYLGILTHMIWKYRMPVTSPRPVSDLHCWWHLKCRVHICFGGCKHSSLWWTNIN